MKANIKAHMEANAMELARDVWPESQPANSLSSGPGACWHVVHCVGRGDGQALDWLKKLGLEYYYPMIRELRPELRKKLSRKQRASGVSIMRPRLVPFMPRYTFVRFDMGRPGWREIFSFAGIGGMVCEGDLPVAVPDSLVASIRDREIDGAVPGKTPARMLFRLGERVRVSSGPFASFDAVIEKMPNVPIEEIDSDTRIRVAVGLFGGATPVELLIGQIEKQ